MDSIRITLMSDLCVGNGESVGYGVDSDICKDNYGFPYIPGKRLLGCLREASCQLIEMGFPSATDENIIEIYGDENGREGKLRLTSATLPGVDTMQKYVRSLSGKENGIPYLAKQSSEERIVRLFTTVRGQTKIDKYGKAEKGTLRFIRVLNQYDPFSGNPLVFVCGVDTGMLTDDQKKLFLASCKALRHIGMNRNRGLGNIRFEYKGSEDESDQKGVIVEDNSSESDLCRVSYQVSFDSPITIQDYFENNGQIKARTVIGVFSTEYLKNHGVDDVFESLFLNGSVKWSSLTPVINGVISEPVPAMIMKLKNDNGRLINTLSVQDDGWKKMKPKSLEGYYGSSMDNHYCIASPGSELSFHNRIHGVVNGEIEKKGLYTQGAIEEGLIYGGYVIVPREMLDIVKKLLSVSSIRIGRSKKVQYGLANIQKIVVNDYNDKTIEVEEGEEVFAILRSDMVIYRDAQIRVDDDTIRMAIAEKSGLENVKSDNYDDICNYHVLTGYHTMWQMQKPKLQAVMSGSLYCFKPGKGNYPSRIVVGEYQQEGFGVVDLVTKREMMGWNKIESGMISKRTNKEDDTVKQKIENKFLFEAAMDELDEYAFKYKQSHGRDRSFRDIPVVRLRQMLHDASDIDNLWKMVKSMKTSDVSSESRGKRRASIDLLEEFYGNEGEKIDIEKFINDKTLCNRIKNNQEVYQCVLRHWKEPLFTLLHIMHYQGR